MREELLALMAQMSDADLERAARAVGINVEKEPEIPWDDPSTSIESWNMRRVGVSGVDNRQPLVGPKDWKVLTEPIARRQEERGDFVEPDENLLRHFYHGG